jgi:hypothetical protein
MFSKTAATYSATARAGVSLTVDLRLIGDLNAEPTSDELRLLTAPASPTWCCWTRGAMPYRAIPASPGTDATDISSRASFPTPASTMCWWGCHSTTGGRIETVRLGGNAPVNGVWPSDHFAVIADLSE